MENWTGDNLSGLESGAQDAHSDRKSVIMVVEDEPEVAEVAIMIAQTLGYEVFWCRSVEAAFERIGQCDLVFTDMFLQGDSGLDLIERIRAEGNGIPIVATAGNEALLGKALKAGANVSIPKPWRQDDLRRTFAELLG